MSEEGEYSSILMCDEGNLLWMVPRVKYEKFPGPAADLSAQLIIAPPHGAHLYSSLQHSLTTCSANYQAKI